MNECPECGGLLIQDDGSDDFLLEPVDDYYCPGCSWSTGDEVVSYDPDDSDDFPRYDDEESFQHCSSCDGHDACADFGCAIRMGLSRLVKSNNSF